MNSSKKYLAVFASLLLLFAVYTTPAFAEGSRVGTVTADLLNVRESPSTSASVLTRVSSGAQLMVLDQSDDWYKVNTGDTEGWVASQYVTVGDSSTLTGTITGDDVNIRNGAGLWADVITRLNQGEKVSVVGRYEDWYNISLSDGTIGWVSANFLTMGTVSRAEDVRTQIINYAKKFIGVPYVYGGSTPYGFDCSGFVKYVLNNFGIDLYRVAADQATQGVPVSRSELRAGDLVFFATEGGSYISHVGMYLGDGTFIHASSGSVGAVTISSLSGYYANTYVRAVRVVR